MPKRLCLTTWNSLSEQVIYLYKTIKKPGCPKISSPVFISPGQMSNLLCLSLRRRCFVDREPQSQRSEEIG